MPHMSYRDIASAISRTGWGQSYDTVEEAARDLMDDSAKLAAFGIMELLSRLDRLGGRTDYSGCESGAVRMPSEDCIRRFPDKQIGDKLYECYGGLGDGAKAVVIVAKDEDGKCLVTDTDWDLDIKRPCYVAAGNTFATYEEAVRDMAIGDIKHHSVWLDHAETVHKALSEGDSDKLRVLVENPPRE